LWNTLPKKDIQMLKASAGRRNGGKKIKEGVGKKAPRLADEAHGRGLGNFLRKDIGKGIFWVKGAKGEGRKLIETAGKYEIVRRRGCLSKAKNTLIFQLIREGRGKSGELKGKSRDQETFLCLLS